MFLKATSAILSACLLAAAIRPDASVDRPQIIKLERFRKALWTVRVTVNGVSGNFLLDTGGGNTLVTEPFAAIGFELARHGPLVPERQGALGPAGIVEID